MSSSYPLLVSGPFEIIQACVVFKEEEGKAFQYLHCWNVLQHHRKWTERLSQKKHKVSSNSSPGTSSPISSNASPLDAKGDAPTPQMEPFTTANGKKVEKEHIRQGKSSSSSTRGNNIYMEALDNIWAKKREMDVQKELKKDERYERAYAIEQENVANEKRRIAMEQEKLELKRRMDDERIMRMDIGAMSGPQQEYYLSFQREIIAHRCNRSG